MMAQSKHRSVDVACAALLEPLVAPRLRIQAMIRDASTAGFFTAEPLMGRMQLLIVPQPPLGLGLGFGSSQPLETVVQCGSSLRRAVA